MQLTKELKNEFRSKIQNSLQINDLKKRIFLDKDLLEQLLFDEVVLIDYKTKEEVTSKYIAWSGEFLRKIDLSEVDFSNVIWDQYAIQYDENNNYMLKDKSVDTLFDMVDLSYTNAVIDFSKSSCSLLDKKVRRNVILSEVNLEGVDLSNSNTELIANAYDCNFKNTNAVLDLSLPRKDENNIIFSNCNLSGLDLSKYTINILSLYTEGLQGFYYDENNNVVNKTHQYKEVIFPRINLALSDIRNTRLNIEITTEDLKNGNGLFLNFTEIIDKDINNDKFAGCTLNGKEMLPIEEIDKNINEQEQTYINKELSDFYNQIEKLRR